MYVDVKQPNKYGNPTMLPTSWDMISYDIIIDMPRDQCMCQRILVNTWMVQIWMIHPDRDRNVFKSSIFKAIPFSEARSFSLEYNI